MRILVLLLLVGASSAVHGEEIISRDYQFPGAGRFSASVATGIPYVAIGELAYGLTDRFSVGVIAGITPKVPGLGLRIRGVVYQRDSVRLFYYPKTKGLGGEPWILTYPSLRLEVERGRARYHAGAGGHRRLLRERPGPRAPPGRARAPRRRLPRRRLHGRLVAHVRRRRFL